MRRRRFSNNLFDHLDKSLAEKISIWMLRVLFIIEEDNKLFDSDIELDSDFKEYLKIIGLDMDDIQEQYENINDKNWGRENRSYHVRKARKKIKIEILESMENKYNYLISKDPLKGSRILDKNIKKVSTLMNLNLFEEKILEFVLLSNCYEILEECLDKLGNNNRKQSIRLLSKILDISNKEVIKAFENNSILSRSGLIFIRDRKCSMVDNFELISDRFSYFMLNHDVEITEMFGDIIKPCSYSDLKISDFEYMSDDLKILIQYLKKSNSSTCGGKNILFYGPPGTGKTEFVKVLAKFLGRNLYEISYEDNDGIVMISTKRLMAYNSSQRILQNKKNILMFDEVEELFGRRESIFGSHPQQGKSWINRSIEESNIPTIWISNGIKQIDNAIIRRFDMCIEFPVPGKSIRREIIRKYSQEVLNEKDIDMIADNEKISPALISKAIEVSKQIKKSDRKKSVLRVINNELKAQGYKTIKKIKDENLLELYSPGFINCDVDLSSLEQDLKKSPNARICLYGVPGTGKSAFAKYLARSMDKELILRKGSDLLNPYVGMTEAHISQAFKEADRDDAILVFDEVDSFLQERSNANRSWEVTMVNEMLVQMENFNGIFIATTNIMDSLDAASMRRFDLKIKFNCLKPEQVMKMIISHCEFLGFQKPGSSHKKMAEKLRHITPGNFGTVMRQNRFRPIKDTDDLIQRLFQEVSLRESEGNIGFTF